MALVTWEDFQNQAVSNPSLKVYQLANSRIHDTAKPMPPTGTIPPQDRALIETWFTNNAPAANDPSCAPPQPMGSGGQGQGGQGQGGQGQGGQGQGGQGQGGQGQGGQAQGGQGQGGQNQGGQNQGGVVGAGGYGGTGGVPSDLGPCYTLSAHASGNKSAPLSVNSQEYVEFYFDAPWAAGSQGISFTNAFDAHPEILHHWLLYLDDNGNNADGTVVVKPNGGTQSSNPTLIASWAPGANNSSTFPPDVGMDINGKSRKLLLEIHFYVNGSFNTTSGVKVCTAKTPRPNTAAVSWLGSESITIPAGQPGSASGTCTPYNQTAPIHLLRTWPHMHLLGRHMKTVVTHKAGGTEILVDKDFNFDSQLAWDTGIILQPGDTLATTCNFDNTTNRTVNYGPLTTDEMCYNFVTAWPEGALQAFPFPPPASGASSACLH